MINILDELDDQKRKWLEDNRDKFDVLRRGDAVNVSTADFHEERFEDESHVYQVEKVYDYNDGTVRIMWRKRLTEELIDQMVNELNATNKAILFGREWFSVSFCKELRSALNERMKLPSKEKELQNYIDFALEQVVFQLLEPILSEIERVGEEKCREISDHILSKMHAREDVEVPGYIYEFSPEIKKIRPPVLSYGDRSEWDIARRCLIVEFHDTKESTTVKRRR